MTILNILTYPDPRLRVKSKPVTKFDAEFQNLVNNMLETMRDAPGVGLAAPQIGEPLQLVVVEYKEEDEDENAKPKRYVLVNPQFTGYSEQKVTDLEGCLSVPGLVGSVERSEAVSLKALNRFGKPLKLNVEGWLARIFQHEIDHLDGVLYVDKALEVHQPSAEEAEQVQD
ncbi:MAG: peptide deformylase [Anaerolineaceae bacterium]|nr:peptide deformylase [Anaerolineaceae bacterium]